MTDGGHEIQYELTAEELGDLAAEYRDALMRDLGVVGIEHANKGRDFENMLRQRYPVENAASTDDTFNGVGNSRILYDVNERDDDGETVSGHPESSFATVRETTGKAAIFSSATLTLCWKELPSPREILVAEYLEGMNDRELKPEFGLTESENAAEQLIDILFDSILGHSDELPFPWIELSDTTIDNVSAIKHHVVGTLTTIDDNEMPSIETVRFEKEHGRDGDDGPYSRWATGIGGNANLAVEAYSTGWRGRQKRAFIQTFERFGETEGWPEGEWTEVESLTSDRWSSGWGYVDGEVETEVFGNDNDRETVELDMRVVCIPECRHPSDVLDGDDIEVDLSHATPETPLSGPREENNQ